MKESKAVKLSVVVPVYNGEAYIEECIRSICRQAYGDFELIVIDDGSTDGTLAIAEGLESEYAEQNIKIVRQENRGLVAARQRGIAEAEGAYIAFVDGDDWIEPGYHARMMELATSQDLDMVCAGYTEEHISKGKVKSRPFRAVKRPAKGGQEQVGTSKEARTLSKEEALYRLFDRSGVYQYAWNKVFRKSLLEHLDIPKGNPIGEDFALVTQAMENMGEMERVGVVDHCGYHYRQHEGNMTKRAFGIERLQGYELYKSYLANFQGSEEQRKALKRYMMLEYLYCFVSMQRSGKNIKSLRQEIRSFVKGNKKDYIKNSHDRTAAKLLALLLK